MPSQTPESSSTKVQSLFILQAVLAALLTYVVVRTHEHCPEENRIVFIVKFSLLILFLALIAFNALA